MQNANVDFRLKGIIPPLVTPLLEGNKLDEGGLVSLIEHVIAGGVHGLFILGTTGEISRLSAILKEELIRMTCQIVDRRIPVLVGITDTSIHESIRLERIAAEEGADAVVLAPPFFYHVEQDELLDYFYEVADRIKRPLYLYNMPSRTHININIDTVVAAANHPNIHGIKDSSGDLMYLQDLIYAVNGKEDFSIFVGPEEIMAQAVLMGADGGVNGGGNLFPKLFVDLYDAAQKRDVEQMQALQSIVTHISNTLYKVGIVRPNFSKIIKEALFQKHICNSPVMEKPYIPFSEEEREKVAVCLENIKLPVSHIN